VGPLLTFFALTYVWSWALFGAAAWGASHTATGAAPGLAAQLFVPGAFGPAVVAILLTVRARGKQGLRALLTPILAGDVDSRWYVFAIVFMPAVKLVVAVVHRGAMGSWPRFGSEPWYVIAAAIFISTPFQAGEEIGWRGFALPRLADRLGLARASLVLGAIWATWHLPLFFIPVTDTYRQSFPLYFLQVVALSVAAAWIWARTGGSLLVVMLMHSAVNQTIGIVPSATLHPTGWLTTRPTTVGMLTVLVLWIVAAYLLARMPTWEGPEPAA
jgi:CAAX protease family protein